MVVEPSEKCFLGITAPPITSSFATFLVTALFQGLVAYIKIITQLQVIVSEIRETNLHLKSLIKIITTEPLGSLCSFSRSFISTAVETYVTYYENRETICQGEIYVGVQ